MTAPSKPTTPPPAKPPDTRPPTKPAGKEDPAVMQGRPLDWDSPARRGVGLEHTVYAHLDASGRPLYVGCTSDLNRRTTQHRSKAPWWPLVVEVRVIGTWGSKQLALAVEQGIIARFQPPHNVKGTPRWPEMCAAHYAPPRSRRAA